MRSKSKNTPFDGWPLRGGVAATIVGGRTVYVNEDVAKAWRLRGSGLVESTRAESRMDVDRRADIRNKALKDLQESGGADVDGHFDYGNGYHGRVYLNPHQLFRHPSTIWRFAQDLIDVLPGDLDPAHRSRGGTGDGRRAARAHDRGTARQPPQPDASALQLRAVHPRRDRRADVASVLSRGAQGQAGAAGRRRAEYGRDAGARGRAGRRGRRDGARDGRKSTTVWKRSATLGVPNIALAEYKAPENYPVADCPLCQDGVPITRF